MNDAINIKGAATVWDVRLIQVLLIVIIGALTCLNYQVFTNQIYTERFMSQAQEVEEPAPVMKPDSILKGPGK